MKRFIFLTLSLVLLLVLIPGCVTVQPPVSQPAQPSVIGSFSSNPSAINSGGSSTLSWNVTGANSVSIDQGIGQVNATGTMIVSPTVNTTYTLTAQNLSSQVNSSATITMTPGTMPPIISINAAAVALTLADVAANGWVLDSTGQPFADDTISTYSITFKRGEESLTSSVFTYPLALDLAQYHFYTDQLQAGSNAQTIYSLGDMKAYVIMNNLTSEDMQESYSIRFVKNNTYVKLGSIFNYTELETYSKLMATRIP